MDTGSAAVEQDSRATKYLMLFDFGPDEIDFIDFDLGFITV